MKKFSEYLLSEKVTAAIALLVLIGVVFGLFVGGQRDGLVEQAESSIAHARTALAQMTNSASNQDATSEDITPDFDPVTCDAALVPAEILSNSYVQLELKPTPLHPLDLKKGYGPGLFISSKLKEDGGDSYVTANRLYKAIKKTEKDMLRGIEIDKEERFIQFSILLSADIRCTNQPEVTNI